MTEPLAPLPDDLRALLQRAQDARLLPPAGAEDLVLAKVTATVGAAAAATAGVAAGSKLATWGVGKTLAALALGGAMVGGGAVLWSFQERPAPTPSVAASTGAADEPPAPPAVPSVPAPAPPIAPAVAPAAPPAAAPSPAAPPRPKADAAAEGALLESAREALARDDAARAKEALLEHERRFPQGQLREERRALTVVALAQLGEMERAQRAARAFEEQHPESLFLEVVRAAVAP